MTPFRLSLISIAFALAAGGASAQSYQYDRGYDPRDSGYYEDDRYGDDGYYEDDRYGDDRYGDDRYYDEPSVNYPPSRTGQYGRTPPAYDLARVTNVSPIVERGRPMQVRECLSEPSGSYANHSNSNYPRGYQERAPYGTRTSGTGTVIGAIAGGVLGNSVGSGDGRKAATVIGAVLGGAIGNDIERNNGYRRDAYGQNAYGQNPYGQDPYGRQAAYRGGQSAERCRMVTRQGGDARVVGYRVNYEYAGRQYETVTDHHPGSQLRVRVDVSPAG